MASNLVHRIAIEMAVNEQGILTLSLQTL